jgi:hypothetical protein
MNRPAQQDPALPPESIQSCAEPHAGWCGAGGRHLRLPD